MGIKLFNGVTVAKKPMKEILQLDARKIEAKNHL